MKIEVLAAGIELDFFSLDNCTRKHLGLHSTSAYIVDRISSYCDLQQEHNVEIH